jgi:3-hydroxyisobutyrate dehydrogenase-like beta-hydroxyacid dehydrogenase
LSRVAVVGLGAMSSRIARRLLERGHEVVVWNRNRAKATPLADAGAAVARTAAEAAASSEAVITMVTDPAALEAVTQGPDGVLAASSTTLIQMSTVGPRATARLAESLPREAALLDAPVLGSISEAESGTLRIYAGGDQDLVERWRPLLSDFGLLMHVGGVGAGSSAKLVVNAVLVGVIGVLGESLALGKALGLSRNTAFDVLETTALGEQAKRRRAAVESGEFPPRFTLSLARKDADLILEVAPGLAVIEAARAWLAHAEQAGRGGEDYSAVLAHIMASAA